MNFSELIGSLCELEDSSPDALKAILCRISTESIKAWMSSNISFLSIERHPNNFYKIRLARLRNGISVRLHIWAPSTDGDSSIHNHRWNFASKLLQGSYEQTLYQITEGSETLRRSYRRDGSEDTDVAVHAVNAVPILNEKIRPGTTHCLEAETYHRVHSIDPYIHTITLFVTGIPLKQMSSVICLNPLESKLSRPTPLDSLTAQCFMKEALNWFHDGGNCELI